MHTIERRKRRETGAWSSKRTNTHTNKGSVKKTSRPNALQTPSPGFDGLTAGTIESGGRRGRVHTHTTNTLSLCRQSCLMRESNTQILKKLPMSVSGCCIGQTQGVL